MHGGASERFTKDKRFSYGRQNRECGNCERYQQESQKYRLQRDQLRVQNKVANDVAESRGLQLFYCLKEAKNYDDAGRLYNELIATRGPTQRVDEATLHLKQSYAAMLIDQKKFSEAEPISRAVWEERILSEGLASETLKESFRQLCSVLCALERYEEAADKHRTIYERERRGLWALENGDEWCQRLREQRQIKKAKDLQDEVWKARKEQDGPRDGLTIRSVLRLVRDLDELVKTIDKGASTDAERKLNDSKVKCYQDEIEVVLQEVWSNKLHPEPIIGILDAGHRYGTLLFDHKIFPTAEEVLKSVWEGKKQKLGDNDPSTMTTSRMLGRALCDQDKQETYHKAVLVLGDVWQFAVKRPDAETIPTAEYLAHAYRSLRDWRKAEQVYGWIVHYKGLRGDSVLEIDSARWNLGQALFNQGKSRSRETEVILLELYTRWVASFPNAEQTLQCGHMIAQAISTQDGKRDEALKFAQDVYRKMRDSKKRGVAYLDSARMCGSLLLEDNKSLEAEEILKSGWEQQTHGIEEQKMRLKCGHLYGQMLLNRKSYADAEKILEAVTRTQEELSVGADEVSESHKLLEEAHRLKKEKEKERRKRASPQWRSRKQKA